MAVAEGDAIKATESPAVYVIEGGRRRWIPDAPTFDSQWTWDRVHLLSATEVDAIPLGSPIPSVITPPSFPDGMLVVGSRGIVYVIEGGKRRWIPDPATLAVMGYDWSVVQHIADSLLNAIPEGPAIPPVRYLAVNVDTNLGAGHFMSTGATLVESGRLEATTRTRSVVWLGGYTGGVRVVFGDVNGVAIGASALRTFGVDGTIIGTSDRVDHWTEDIDPSVARRTASLSVVHAWVPKVRLNEIVDAAVQVGLLVVEILKETNQAGDAGGGTGPTRSPWDPSWPSDTMSPPIILSAPRNPA